jgi:hypothetical protein
MAIGLLAAPASAGRIAEARLHVTGGTVRVDLRALELLDPRTASTIDSGLPGTCVFGLQIESRREIVVEQFIEQHLRLDLWENIYLLRRGIAEQRFSSLASADSAWSHLKDVELVRRSVLLPERQYRLVVQVAVRPLAAEDRERMSRYVKKHSGSGSEELSLDLGALFSGMFGRGNQEQVVRFETGWFRPSELEVRP